MTTIVDYQALSRAQIAIGVAIGALGIALAAFAPTFATWLLPALGILWAVGAVFVAARLSKVGAPSRSLLTIALVIGIAAVIRLAYLLRHAA